MNPQDSLNIIVMDDGLTDYLNNFSLINYMIFETLVQRS